LRFNIYQPVTGDSFTLSYEHFWDGILQVLESTEIVTISEPLVNALIGFTRPTAGSPCGKTSLRTLPDRRVSPCTYWPSVGGPDRLDLDKLFGEGPAVLGEKAFMEARHVPTECRSCAFVESCGGGCASRRKLRGRLNHADEYCPVIRQDEKLLGRIKNLNWQAAPFKDLPKAGNACTFVVKGRPTA
jgi:radical SAM protein with 4Fe4S-binding SPASM domain